MFDFMEFQVFGPGELIDFYSTSSPACALQDHDPDQDQGLAAFFPELIESDWQEHRCSQSLIVRNSKITVVKQKIQTTANLEDPVARAHLVEQLSAVLVNQGVTDFRLAWKKIEVK